jgi:DNA-binding MarR family transcriptional regulator
MEQEKLLEIVGYVKVSEYRTQTLKFIGTSRKMPSEIAKELGIGTSHASNVLRSLKKYDLVVCSNPNVRKGRLYENTQLGHEILRNLD